MLAIPTPSSPVLMTISFCHRMHQVVAGSPAMAAHGLIARRPALDRCALPRFLHDWDLAFREAAEIAVRVP